MAAHLGRPIEPYEDVHHEKCRTVRCVEPEHLAVIPMADHQAHHGAEKRQELCSVHGTPYDRQDSRGFNVCLKCRAEASARWRQRNPLTEDQREQHKKACRLYRQALKAKREQAA
jgi:hypothetical protein